MWLDDVWFVLFVIIIAGYLILDGFDLGVGILHTFIARNDDERRVVLNSIGPIWDGNEVWLVVGGGVLFAAFPAVYSALLSGFYWAIMLLLLFLILRTSAIEFRSKRESPAWRSLWDGVFFGSSALLALLLGVAFGNIVRGVPLDAEGEVDMTFPDLINPFSVWLGVTTVVMLAFHGALYLQLKTEGELRGRLQVAIPWLMGLFALMGMVTVVALPFANDDMLDVYAEDVWVVVFPLLALAAFVYAALMLRRGRDFAAFLGSAAMIAFSLFSAAAGLYPDLLPSSTDSQNSLTLNNAAAEENTLTVMAVMALIAMPFVLLYTAGVHYIFRGKVRLTSRSY